MYRQMETCHLLSPCSCNYSSDCETSERELKVIYKCSFLIIPFNPTLIHLSEAGCHLFFSLYREFPYVAKVYNSIISLVYITTVDMHYFILRYLL